MTKILFLSGSLDQRFHSMELLVEQACNREYNVTIVGGLDLSHLKSSMAYIVHHRTLEKKRYRDIIESANRIVTHAGVGSTIDLMTLAKRFFCLPRTPLWEEHVDDHQLQWSQLLTEWSLIDKVDGCLGLDQVMGYNFGVEPQWVDRVKQFKEVYFDWDEQAYALDKLIDRCIVNTRSTRGVRHGY